MKPVLLVYVPGHETGYGPIFPLGMGYLLSAICQDREAMAVNYESMDNFYSELPKIISSFNPFVIGLTCTTFNRGNVKKVIKHLKKNYPTIRIVVGGVHASLYPKHMLIDYDADFVVIGEGEETFRELCHALNTGRPPHYVDGIAYKIANTIVHTNDKREVIKDLDKLNMPNYCYAGDTMKRSKLGTIITSRGCPAHCTFCSTSNFWGQTVRVNSPKRVVDEIELLIESYGVNKILFHDDTFNLGEKRVLAICKEIMARNIHIDWSCCCRVHPVSDEMIETMVKAGCKHICWGVESGSEEVLKKVNKNITKEQIKKAFDICEKYIGSISVGSFTMVGNPGETYKTIQESVDFFNTLPMTDSPTPSALYVLPGTEVFSDMKKRNSSLDNFWIKSEGILRYDEYNPICLSEWVHLIMKSGKIIPFDRNKHFLKGVLF